MVKKKKKRLNDVYETRAFEEDLSVYYLSRNYNFV